MRSRVVFSILAAAALLSCASCSSGETLNDAQQWVGLSLADGAVGVQVASCGPPPTRVAVLRVDDQPIDDVNSAERALTSGADPGWASGWSVGAPTGAAADGVPRNIDGWTPEVDGLDLDLATSIEVVLLREDGDTTSYVGIPVSPAEIGASLTFFDAEGDRVDPPKGRFDCGG